MFKEKLNKTLAKALEEAGLSEPTAFQQKCLSKINSGADVIGADAPGSGRTTLLVIATIQKLQQAFEDAPRAFILVAGKEEALAMKALFDLLGKETNLRSIAVFEEGKLEKQNEEIYFGMDIVIGTPRRSVELYLSRNFNISKIKLFAIDDAELFVKHAWQGYVDRLGLSLPKCQHLIFTKELNEKVEKMVHKFVVAPVYC